MEPQYMVYCSYFRHTTGPFDTLEKANEYIKRSLNNRLKTDYFLVMQVLDKTPGLCDKLIDDD